MPSQLVAVTGANGFVGGNVLAKLHASGVLAVGLVRPGRENACPEGMRRVVPEWSEGVLRSTLEGVGVVIHAASVVHRAGAGIAEHRAFNVGGTRSLLAAARGAGVRRVIFLSTIKVYGEAPAGTVDENTAIDRSSPYAATKHDAEQVLLDGVERGGPSVVVLRLCPVYGVGDKGNVRRVAIAISRRRFVVPGNGATRKSLVHVSTVTDAVLRAVRADFSGTFVLSDRVAPSIRELADTIARHIGRRRPLAIPTGIVFAAAASVERVTRFLGWEPSVSVELIRKSLRSTVCSPARLEQVLGMECHVDLEVGVREEISWLRREGLL